jgi:hypothetical protein
VCVCARVPPLVYDDEVWEEDKEPAKVYRREEDNLGAHEVNRCITHTCLW